MSELKKLLQDVEVEWKTLGEVAEIGTGSRNTNEATSNGKYPFFVRSQIPRLIDEYEFDEIAIITAGDGVGVGKVFHYIEGKYALHQRAYRIVVKHNNLDPKYLFFYIKSSFSKYIEKISVHASVTSLRRPMFEKYPIPIPCPDQLEKSLKIQTEIVRILDSLSEETTKLNTALQSELGSHQKRYEYYREELFKFEGKVVEWKTLSDVGKVKMCKRIFKKETQDIGDIPFYKIGTFGKQADSYISKELYEVYKRKYSFPNIGDILISAAGTIGRTVVYNGEPAYFQDSNIIWLENDESLVSNKYLWHFYKIAKWYVSGGGIIDRLYNDNVRKTKISIPYPNDSRKSLREQNRIVKILDELDSTTQSITTEIKKEIELRNKQFEYYRDRLLSFPKEVSKVAKAVTP